MVAHGRHVIWIIDWTTPGFSIGNELTFAEALFRVGSLLGELWKVLLGAVVGLTALAVRRYIGIKHLISED